MITDDPSLRLPPHNLDAEREFLSALMLNPDLIDEFAALDPEDLYRDDHQVVLRGLRALRDSGAPVGPVALIEELSRTPGLLERIGGPTAIADLIAAAPHAANAGYHAAIVQQKAVVRRLIAQATETLRECYAGTLSASQLVDSADGETTDLPLFPRLIERSPSAPSGSTSTPTDPTAASNKGPDDASRFSLLLIPGFPWTAADVLQKRGIHTIGDLATFTNGGAALTDVKGIGPATAEKALEALADFWRKRGAA